MYPKRNATDGVYLEKERTKNTTVKYACISKTYSNMVPTFSLAISADLSLLTSFFDVHSFANLSACSSKTGYIVWIVSSRNRSLPWLATKETETGHFS